MASLGKRCRNSSGKENSPSESPPAKSQLKELKEENIALRDENWDLKLKMTSVKTYLQHICISEFDTQQKAEKAEGKVIELEEELDVASKKATHFQLASNNLGLEVQCVEKEARRCQLKLMTAKKKNRRLLNEKNRERNLHAKEMEELKLELQKERRAFSALQNDMDQKDKTISNLRRKDEKIQAELADTNRSLAEALEKIEKLSAGQAQLPKSYIGLQIQEAAQVEDISLQLAKAEGESSEWKRKHESLTDAYNKEIQGLASDAESRNQLLAQIQLEFESSVELNQDLINLLETAKAESNRNETQLQAAEASITQLNNELTDLRFSNMGNRNLLNSTRAQLAEANRLSNATYREKEEFRRMFDELNDKNKSLREENALLTERQNALVRQSKAVQRKGQQVTNQPGQEVMEQQYTAQYALEEAQSRIQQLTDERNTLYEQLEAVLDAQTN